MASKERVTLVLTKPAVFSKMATAVAVGVIGAGVVFATAFFIAPKSSNLNGMLLGSRGWDNICNNGQNYELTSNQQIYSGRIRKPTSYIKPGGSITLGLRNLTIRKSKFNLNYTYVTNQPSAIGITGSVASDIVTDYDNYEMFIDISIPELSSCTNVKQPMRIMTGDPFLGNNIAFIYPKDIIPAEVLPPGQPWATISVEKMMKDFDVMRTLDWAYQFQKKMYGHPAFDGDIILNGLKPDWCGAAGQPTGFGVGCLIAPNNQPNWGVILHETGHNGDNITLQFYDGLGVPYVSHRDYFAAMPLYYTEGWATLAALYAEHGMTTQPAPYNVSRQVLTQLTTQFNQDTQNYLNDLHDYESAGADFATMNPNIIDGIFTYLATNNSITPFGWEVYPQFFKVYSDPLPSFIQEPLTEVEAHTYVVAGLSAAVNRDLRYLFRDQWHFPVDDQYFDTILPILRSRIGN